LLPFACYLVLRLNFIQKVFKKPNLKKKGGGGNQTVFFNYITYQGQNGALELSPPPVWIGDLYNKCTILW